MRLRILGTILLNLVSLSVLADVGPPQGDALMLRGFGTLGIARSTTDQAQFVRDLSQPDGITDRWSAKIDSLFGLQANLQLAAPLEAVAQVVSRYHSDGTYRPELMWGFLKLDPNPTLSLRLGRLGTEFYMLSDSRLVGYSYVTVRPPNDYFGGLPFSYVDGGDVLLTSPLGEGLLRAKLSAGWSREQVPLADQEWDLDRSLILGGYLDYQWGAWQWRLGYSQIRFRHELPIEPLLGILDATGLPSAREAANALSVTDKLARFTSLGVVYDSGPLQVQWMLSRTDQESRALENSRAGYLLASYQIAKFRPFLGVSWVKSSRKSLETGLPAAPPFTQIDAAVATVMRDSHSDQRTVSLGVRWDFRDNMALKVQWDAIRGRPDSVFPYRWEVPGWDGRTNIFSLALDFVF